MVAAKGAKIVCDFQISKIGEALAPAVKRSKDFGDIIAQVRQEAFDPAYLQHVEDFTLKHPQSWRSFAPGEQRAKE